jgi:hypothetical protein
MSKTLNELVDNGMDFETEEHEAIADKLEQACAVYGIPSVDLEQALENPAG